MVYVLYVSVHAYIVETCGLKIYNVCTCLEIVFGCCTKLPSHHRCRCLFLDRSGMPGCCRTKHVRIQPTESLKPFRFYLSFFLCLSHSHWHCISFVFSTCHAVSAFLYMYTCVCVCECVRVYRVEFCAVSPPFAIFLFC